MVGTDLADKSWLVSKECIEYESVVIGCISGDKSKLTEKKTQHSCTQLIQEVFTLVFLLTLLFISFLLRVLGVYCCMGYVEMCTASTSNVEEMKALLSMPNDA